MTPRRASRAVLFAFALAGCTGSTERVRSSPTATPPSASPSSSPAPLPSLSPGPSVSPPSCRGHQGLAAEVDGDRRPDVVYVAEVGGEMTLGACTGAGRYVTLHVAGMGELFHLVDVERDGRDEMLVGGTWVSGGGVDVIRYDRGRLRFVMRGGERLWLRFELNPDSTDGSAGWGCRPERGELVQVTVDWRRRVARTETYVLRGLRAVRTSVRTMPAPGGRPDGEYAGRVAGSCPGLRG